MSAQKTVFAGNKNSQYDSSLIVKEVHDFFGQSIRTLDTRSVISGYFTHFRATYDGNNNPLTINYFRGTKSYLTSVTCVSAASLNSHYFVLHSAPDNQLYLIWYNVDGAGSAPVVANSKLIQVNVSSSDSPEIVAAATKITIDNLFSDIFTTGTRTGAYFEIETNGMGDVDGSFDVNTSFTISGTAGEQKLVTSLDISYTGTDPIFEGQLLKDYNFDIYSGKFVKNPTVSIGSVNVSLSSLTDSVAIADSSGNPLVINPSGSINVKTVPASASNQYSEQLGVVNGVTTELITYTAVTNILLQKIEFSGTNIAEYELTIDNVTQDKKRTYFGILENKFDFNDGIGVTSGQVIKVLVVHNRPDNGDFNCRLQLLQE